MKQARKPRSYASPKLCPPTHLLTDLLTGVKCRATSVAKNNQDLLNVQILQYKTYMQCTKICDFRVYKHTPDGVIS